MLRRNVLIFQMGGLGDFILTWPLAVMLGRIYPQSRIFYVTHRQKGDLAKRVLRLEATDAEAGWHSLFAEGGELPAAAEKLLQSAHAVYTFLPTSAVWNQNVQLLSPGFRCVELPANLPAGSLQHLTEWMVDGLQNPEKSALQQMLRSIDDRGIGFKPVGGNAVVIHPGAGGVSKRWPVEKFVQLGHRLQESGKSVRCIIGEVEREQFSSEDRKKLSSVGVIRDCETCLDLLNEISAAGVFVGNDSGPGHLAGIIGVPTVALFGPTNPANWKPLGPSVRVVSRSSMNEIQVEEVLNEIEKCFGLAQKKEVKIEISADD